MKVELLHFDGCPNWRLTEERLIAALRAVNRLNVTVVRRRVDTDVLIDGRDPFATGGETLGLACRVFRSAAGLEGAPTLDQLVEVLS